MGQVNHKRKGICQV